mmetsp:Transcript_36618/g.105347  ORF Transcript_36618/g.105347 Transcript_36618/m.105347 type:complete len:333 (+) Transcript_36618:101-1099(+)
MLSAQSSTAALMALLSLDFVAWLFHKALLFLEHLARTSPRVPGRWSLGAPPIDRNETAGGDECEMVVQQLAPRSTRSSVWRGVLDLPTEVRSIVVAHMPLRDVAACATAARSGVSAMWDCHAVWSLLAALRMPVPELRSCDRHPRDALRQALFRLDASQLRVLQPCDHAGILAEAAFMCRGLVPSDRGGVAATILTIAEPALYHRDPLCAVTAGTAEVFLAEAHAARSAFGERAAARLQRAHDSVRADDLIAQRDLIFQDMHRELLRDSFVDILDPTDGSERVLDGLSFPAEWCDTSNRPPAMPTPHLESMTPSWPDGSSGSACSCFSAVRG